ncbi:MlaA family lipoprotein [Paraburkholderia acidisoli]|uniref:VacJ family lipoprotein n=1 Tax=Paraburkholderia acidisoli TaxID=2571748 RepID=A0A7Z2GL60_9BURK|nr:VacJ family lipoprotein [Paraburkholderia acidisoli]QGZ63843.1 VacJ family lipoprotein [Paraburkholderia acidisoli]
MKKNYAALTMAAASLTLLVTSGCATGPDRKPGDPFEPANRAIFTFNDALDTHIAQPIAKGYQKVTPQPLRQAITNFFSNIGDVSNFANDVLQLKITDATEDLMRLAMNTTFGLGGLIDFATPAGLPKHHQDFGLTMGHYGVPAGPYLVLPLFGPSSVRDGIGMGVETKFNILNYIEPAVRNPMYVAQFVSARADLLGATDLLQQAALDKYSFVRDAYRQQRQSLIRGSQSNNAPLPDYGDPGDTGDGDTAKPNGGAGGSSDKNGLPNYEDPGESNGASGAAGSSGSSNSSNSNGLPNYEDPGESSAGAAGAAAASGAAVNGAGTAAGAGPGAAAAAGTAGVAAAVPAAAASAPKAASAASAAQAASAVKAAPASAASAATAP